MKSMGKYHKCVPLNGVGQNGNIKDGKSIWYATPKKNKGYNKRCALFFANDLNGYFFLD
nr:hypothetical protein [Bacteroides eggerthii]